MATAASMCPLRQVAGSETTARVACEAPTSTVWYLEIERRTAVD